MHTVGDLVAHLERWYPLGTAESWDRVGLTVGDRADRVERVWCTVDVTPEVIAEAIDARADLIVAHHPLMLRGVHTVTSDTAKGRMVSELIRNRVALWSGHTNADCAADGVAEALADALELGERSPLVAAEADRMLNLVVFVPADHLGVVVDALAEAGAGRVGEYDRCHWATEGTGSFRPLDGANPFLGERGKVEQVTEARVELVLPAGRRSAVLAALREAHPYEEPAFHFTDADTGLPVSTGLGRVGTVAEPITLRELGERLAAVLPATSGGVRLGEPAGNPDRTVRRIALLPGAGDSLLDRARALDVDVYITSDLRHHPASEFLIEGGPALIDIAHWAAEWLWLPRLAEKLRGLDPAPEVTVSELNTDPWLLRLG
ncbi:Nif3-like dinuclear metal center hexameric protein [Enemella sp. A6]|uniref:Nif3-like dinuclear metal center hexameric protein n=1 Tax=Enemella sp. A6 TaxID=3440152 RepID=UPI003EC1466E